MTDSEQKLRDRQSELVLIIESANEVLNTKAWQTLKELVFDGVDERLDRQLLAEAKKPVIEADKIYFLQGESAQARRLDLKRYAEMCQRELEGIKNNQNATHTITGDDLG